MEQKSSNNNHYDNSGRQSSNKLIHEPDLATTGLL
jgi:hypothetical protein